MTKTELAIDNVIENLQEALAAAMAAKDGSQDARDCAEAVKMKLACVRVWLKNVR